MSDDNICYSEGRQFGDNACNEIIYIKEDDGLYFQATMAMGFTNFERQHDIKKMDADTMANYLWYRFIERIHQTR